MLIISNWKAYVESLTQAKVLLSAAQKLARHKKHTMVLCVPAPFLGHLAARGSVALGAQDVSASLGGAATGEVIAGQLAAAGATYVIVGHSERRALGETNEVVVEKTRRALAHGLIPIVCVGESARDSDANYLKIIRTELSALYSALTQKEAAKIVIAYEPIWAIGKSSGQSITPDDLHEMVLYLRKVIAGMVNDTVAKKTVILYGGSVDAVNAQALSEGAGINGFLVGHASTGVTTYTDLVKALSA